MTFLEQAEYVHHSHTAKKKEKSSKTNVLYKKCSKVDQFCRQIVQNEAYFKFILNNNNLRIAQTINFKLI